MTKDHREVDALIAQLEEAGNGETSSTSHRETFKQLVSALSVHMKAEEDIFYPAMAKFDEDKDLVVEAFDEHNLVKSLLLQMNELEPSNTEFQENLKQVKAGIKHHVSEEEGELFPDAQERLGEAKLNEMGQQIMSLKSQDDSIQGASA